MLGLKLSRGLPWPLGATWDGQGINFSLFSKHASAVELCLFDPSQQLIATVPLERGSDDIWCGYLARLQSDYCKPGLLYAYRVHGDWQPEQGHRFDSTILLLDPYATDIVANANSDELAQLKSRVCSDNFDWENEKRPLIAPQDTVLYELHVKGFSQSNELVPQDIRGTYLGLSHKASIDHLKTLGVTSVSLLPVHYWLDEARLTALGLSNYWGYNSIGFFAPSLQLAGQASELSVRDQFKHMVKALHENGIEVILDVVYNHTAESDEFGPTLSFRGVDNASYYRLTEPHGVEKMRHYENYSGCGNVLDIRQPAVLRLVMDSLRYWVSEMHVDGFRFDLAPVLGRDSNGFNAANNFLMALSQDPLLRTVKLIAEPWDIGPNGYQLGQFPGGWMEWNDKFRDTVRSYWLQQGMGAAVTRGEFARRLCASADVFKHEGRSPLASVNFIVSHDGFTARDLVSYNERYNANNGEHNRDGHGHNLSNNCGVEGPSTDLNIIARRGALQRALLATLLLAQGTPMLCAGDEMGKSQLGNNNAYCQDNKLSWLDWASADGALNQFVATLLKVRKQWVGLATDQWFGLSLEWFEPDGSAITETGWNDTSRSAFYCTIAESLMLAFNPNATALSLHAPQGEWVLVLDSSRRLDEDFAFTNEFTMPAVSVLALKKRH